MVSQMERYVRNKILILLKEHGEKTKLPITDVDLSDELDIPWREVMDQLEILKNEGMVTILSNNKYGRYVEITSLGKKHLEDDMITLL